MSFRYPLDISSLEIYLNNGNRLVSNGCACATWHVGVPAPAEDLINDPPRFVLLHIEVPNIHSSGQYPLVWTDETLAKQALNYRGKNADRCEFWNIGWVRRSNFWLMMRCCNEPTVLLDGKPCKEKDDR